MNSYRYVKPGSMCVHLYGKCYTGILFHRLLRCWKSQKRWRIHHITCLPKTWHSQLVSVTTTDISVDQEVQQDGWMIVSMKEQVVVGCQCSVIYYSGKEWISWMIKWENAICQTIVSLPPMDASYELVFRFSCLQHLLNETHSNRMSDSVSFQYAALQPVSSLDKGCK